MDKQKTLLIASKLMLADDLATLQTVFGELDELLHSADAANETHTQFGFTGFLKFTLKEIAKMPKNFARYFRADGCTVYYRRRTRTKDKTKYTYEARFRRDGYNISVSGETLQIVKERFIEKLKRFEERGGLADVPDRFDDFAQYYFKNFYVRKVAERTYKAEVGRYNYHIKPYFGNIPMERITSLSCQKLIDKLQNANLGKTAQEVKSILNGIFNMAIRHRIIKYNPLDVIFYKPYTKKQGKALTKQQEALLLNATKDTPYNLMFAVALYTGMRPNEYKTAKIDGDFIVCVNSKQKDGKVHYKKIPIIPMLKPFLVGVDELHFFVVNRISEKLKKILPEFSLKDLRTTFNTRCTECGVNDAARERYMGHKLVGLADTYTDLSEEFLLAESQKVSYTLPPILPPI